MNVWTWIYRACWFLLIAIAFVFVAKYLMPQWQTARAYRHRQAELLRELETEEEMIKLLRMKQERFHTDPEFVERLARDLGLVRSNEVLIRITTATSVPAEVTAPSPAGTRARTPIRSRDSR